MINLTEIFSSVQGEGPFMGRSALFVRLSGCIPPLCPWCDTIHACGPGENTDINDILSRLDGFRGSLAVVTGGEPYLQWESGLNRLEAALTAKGVTVQYETSGKIPIPEESQGFKVCSPKYIDHTWHFVPENILRADCFKFVVNNDYGPVSAFIEDRGIPREKVWIMPLGAEREDQLLRSPAVWDFCVENGFNFSPRLHTLTFNNKRGV